MAVNPYEAAKNLGLGKGYSIGIMAKRPTMPRGPSGPALRMPSFKSPDLSVKLPSVNLKSPTFTQNFDPKVRTMYADEYDAFMANKASEAAKAANATTPATPAVMGTPDATAPKPALGQGNLETPGLGGPGPMRDMESGLREEQKRQNDILMNMSEQDFNAWLNSTGGGGAPGSAGAAMIEARRRKAGGIPPGAVSVANKEGSFSRWQMPGGEVWETNGKGGWRKARGGENSGILQDPWGAAPQVKEPRKFEWNSGGGSAQERDWEAIMDFQRTIGMGRKGTLNVEKALQYPDMVNQSVAKNLTVKNLTPELKASLEAKGFKFKTWDEKLFPGMNKLGDGKLGVIEFGSGVDAMKSLAALKAAGADTDLEGLRQVAYRGMYG
jgi:hypothetical protein